MDAQVNNEAINMNSDSLMSKFDTTFDSLNDPFERPSTSGGIITFKEIISIYAAQAEGFHFTTEANTTDRVINFIRYILVLSRPAEKTPPK